MVWVLWLIKGEDLKVVTTFQLYQNYPNPFNPRTIINYQLPVTSSVELSIYNLLGQKVAVLIDESQQAGLHTVEWNASGFSSGAYYYVLKSGDHSMRRKMMLVK